MINKKIGVIGEGKSGLGEALFMRDYSSEVALITLGKKCSWTKKELKQMTEAKIRIIPHDILAIELSSEAAKIIFSDNTAAIQFDCLYSALGSVKNNQLADDVNAKLKNGFLVVNKDQETSVRGLFAVGDVVSGLNQICVATSQAAIATTAIHSRCRNL